MGEWWGEGGSVLVRVVLPGTIHRFAFQMRRAISLSLSPPPGAGEASTQQQPVRRAKCEGGYLLFLLSLVCPDIHK